MKKYEKKGAGRWKNDKLLTNFLLLLCLLVPLSLWKILMYSLLNSGKIKVSLSLLWWETDFTRKKLRNYSALNCPSLPLSCALTRACFFHFHRKNDIFMVFEIVWNGAKSLQMVFSSKNISIEFILISFFEFSENDPNFSIKF